MHCFIYKGQPKSHNKWKSVTAKQNYIDKIRGAFKAINSSFDETKDQLVSELYGIAYYFYKKDTGTDADNVSKPLWDSLCKYLYADDKQVKLRIAGSIDLNKFDIALLEITNLPPDMIVLLVDALAKEEHFLYVECGLLKETMFKFNLEKS